MPVRPMLLRAVLVSGAALSLLAGAAVAQPAPAAPAAQAPAPPQPVGPFPPIAAPAKLDDVIAKGPAARRAKEKNMLRMDVAERLAKACFAQSARNNQNVTVHIIDQFGQTLYAARMDGQFSVNIETALMKAKTALYFRDSTRVWMNRSIQDLIWEFRMIELGQFPNAGGLPIVVEDQLLGAIGIGGGAMDEACAYEALQSVLGPQPPLAPTLPPRPR